MTLHIACCLWEPNANSQSFSRCYDESWVEKLYRGFQRNLTTPFRFVVFTDKRREFCRGIEQERLVTPVPDYGCLIEPFRLDEPIIVCGLDIVIVGNVDHLAAYTLGTHRLAQPRDPYQPEQSINPIVMAPRGYRRIYDEWRGDNDMAQLRKYDCAFTDDLWPGHILSLKAHDVRRKGLQDARIVYMHGDPKAHHLLHLDWVKEHWR